MLKSLFVKFHMWAAHVSMCNVTQRLCGVGDVYQKVSIRFFFLSTLGARAHPAQRRVHLVTLITNQMISFDCMCSYERIFGLNAVLILVLKKLKWWELGLKVVVAAYKYVDLLLSQNRNINSSQNWLITLYSWLNYFILTHLDTT